MDKVKSVLDRMVERYPALRSVAEDAFSSVSSDMGNDDYRPVFEAKKLANSFGIPVDLNETDPQMLVTAFAELAVLLNGVVKAASNTIVPETELPPYDSEQDDEGYEDEMRKIMRLRKKLTSMDSAIDMCGAGSGFWEKISPRYHRTYAVMLVDLCDSFQVDPLDFWTNKARG